MAKKLFIGGLPWETTDQELRQVFERFGLVSEANVVSDRESGRSRGFGFVTFANDADGTAAMTEMNGTQLDSRTIKVNEAQEPVPRHDRDKKKKKKQRQQRSNQKAKIQNEPNRKTVQSRLSAARVAYAATGQAPVFEVKDNNGLGHQVSLQYALLGNYINNVLAVRRRFDPDTDLFDEVLKAHLILTYFENGYICNGQSMISLLPDWSVRVEVFEVVEEIFRERNKPGPALPGQRPFCDG